jgi:hypothetical protein
MGRKDNHLNNSADILSMKTTLAQKAARTAAITSIAVFGCRMAEPEKSCVEKNAPVECPDSIILVRNLVHCVGTDGSIDFGGKRFSNNSDIVGVKVSVLGPSHLEEPLRTEKRYIVEISIPAGVRGQVKVPPCDKAKTHYDF